MNLSRQALIAGITALGVAVSASPAMAKGGGDGAGDAKANGSVVTFISPDLVLPVLGNGGGGSNRPSRPRA